jgi:hypothetical protein
MTDVQVDLAAACAVLAASVDDLAQQLAEILTAASPDPCGGALVLVLDEHDNRLALGRRQPDGEVRALGSWRVGELRESLAVARHEATPPPMKSPATFH